MFYKRYRNNLADRHWAVKISMKWGGFHERLVSTFWDCFFWDFVQFVLLFWRVMLGVSRTHGLLHYRT